MATKKQLEWRKKFASMAKNGTLKKKRKKAVKKRKKVVKKVKSTPKRKKAIKSKGIKLILSKQGLRLPHGYELVKRKRTVKKKRK